MQNVYPAIGLIVADAGFFLTKKGLFVTNEVQKID